MFISVSLIVASCLAHATPPVKPQLKPVRIISLSPHLTEILFALGKGNNIVGVSDYSDYPIEAKAIPSVASYEGANIASIMRLQPTHVLVWRGGNKDADIQKLQNLGMNIYESSIQSVDDLQRDIQKIGKFIDAETKANNIVDEISTQITTLSKQYAKQQIDVVYYLNSQPLVGLGNDPWLNDLLSLCNIKNIYASSVSSYPQLQMSDIIRQQPSLIIAANKADISIHKAFWLPHKNVLNTKLIQTNPDALHRFTVRAINEVIKVCELAYN